MNLELYRKRIALEGELSRLESKTKELKLLISKDYFAEFRIEGREEIESEFFEEVMPAFKNSHEAILSQSLFEETTFSIWNDLCRKFVQDLKMLLEIRKIEIEQSLTDL